MAVETRLKPRSYKAAAVQAVLVSGLASVGWLVLSSTAAQGYVVPPDPTVVYLSDTSPSVPDSVQVFWSVLPAGTDSILANEESGQSGLPGLITFVEPVTPVVPVAAPPEAPVAPVVPVATVPVEPVAPVVPVAAPPEVPVVPVATAPVVPVVPVAALPEVPAPPVPLDLSVPESADPPADPTQALLKMTPVAAEPDVVSMPGSGPTGAGTGPAGGAPLEETGNGSPTLSAGQIPVPFTIPAGRSCADGLGVEDAFGTLCQAALRSHGPPGKTGLAQLGLDESVPTADPSPGIPAVVRDELVANHEVLPNPASSGAPPVQGAVSSPGIGSGGGSGGPAAGAPAGDLMHGFRQDVHLLADGQSMESLSLPAAPALEPRSTPD